MSTNTRGSRPPGRAALVRGAIAAVAAVLATAAPASALPAVSHSSVGSLAIRITAHPPTYSHLHAAVFDWVTAGIVGETRCKLDGAAYTYCPGHPAHFYGIADGHHTLTVRIRNGYNHVAYASASWTTDSVAPTAPTVSGGSLSWRTGSSIAVSARGGSDNSSGVAGYQHRTQVNGGAWSGPSGGATAAVKTEGQTLVQFRTVDNAGNVSGWAPSPVDATDTVRFDRTPPSVPTVSGGSLSWQGVATVTISGSGSGDARSGIDGYQYRESTDAGHSWSQPIAGSDDVVSAEGETLVQFRATDVAGNASAWVPAHPTASSTARIDRSGPSAPILTGGSLAWRSVASVTVTASGSVDVGFGLDHYEQRVSTDGGTTWSTAVNGPSVTVSAEGQTLVQFRAVDASNNPSAWTPSSPTAAGTVRIDRTAPVAPTVGITPPGWHNASSIVVFAGGSTDALAGVDHYQFRSSLDNGATWTTGVDGATGVVTAEGQTLVQFRAVDGAGNTSAWAPASGSAANTVRIDRTPPTAPAVTGGSAGWQTAASVPVTASGSSDAQAGIDHYESRESTDGGDTWSDPAAGATANVTDEGETLVQFRSVDTAGNTSAWVPASGTGGTVRIDRSAPADPSVTGGSNAWQNAASVTITGTSVPDSGSGVASYEHRISRDGGTTWSVAASGATVAVTAEDETLVQFRSVDAAGNVSGWAPASATAGSTVRLDRTVPTAPTVSGGSLTWTGAGSVAVDGSGGTDGLAGVSGYQYRLSTDSGATWGTAAPGATAVVATEGETVVQFRTVDLAGNSSAWAPATPLAADTVRIDHTPPTAAAASGGSFTWQNAPSIVLNGNSATDPLSGVASYEWRTSTDGGASWGASGSGTTVSPSAEGETIVQFRATDTAGNVGSWAPAPGTVGGTARIDRTAPTAPTVSGGSLTWLSVPSETVAAAGATDSPGSGLSGYQFRTSTDGGTTWSSAQPGAADVISAQGETLVQFRSIDVAGFTSSWVPSVPDAGSTVRIDRTAPTVPTVSGGSLGWQNVASASANAAGSTDAGGSGFAGYEFRLSTDGGATWTGAQPGASDTETGQGETLVQFRGTDGAGNVSAWTPAPGSAAGTIRIDRSPPGDPTVTGGSLSWQNAASVALTAAGSSDSPGSGIASYQYRLSTDGGLTWGSPQTGNPAVVTATGTTVVQMRAVDAAGFTSGWAPSVPDANSTVKLDRTIPTAPTVSGGALSWQNVSGVAISATGSTDSGGAGFDTYQYRTSTDGGTTWSAPQAGSTATITNEGATLVQLRGTDLAGNASAWTPATAGATNTVKIDRTVPTDPTTVAGGSLAWSTAASVAVTASGATDSPGSGIASYQYRTSTDGGSTWGSPGAGASVAVSTQGETVVQFRALDVAGFTSGWFPSSPTAASTVRLDRTAPTAPTLAGGSLTWQNVASLDITASGSTDAASGLNGYQVRTSTNNGISWSNPLAGTSTTITAEGTTIVQYRSMDNAGNSSAWVPSTASGASTAKIDRTAPTDPPTIAGGSLSWLTAASTTVTVSGSVDSPGSGVSTYQYRTSVDGGSTWSTPLSGTAPKITNQGQTLVQFRAVDAAGLVSNWAPSSPTAGSTVRLDRTLPTAPTVSGGSLSWQNVASMTIAGAGSTDAGGSGLDHYEYRTSTTNGASWNSQLTGSSVTISAEGSTIVQIRSVDLAGNVSAWTPATGGATNTVKIDRTAPNAPTSLTGGSLNWQTLASVSVTAAGATDGTGSGVTGYQYHTSTDGGTTWGSAVAGNPVATTAEGETVFQFRAVDGAGNTSGWFPTTPVAGGTVRLDRTLPTAPTVAGGSLSWQNVPSIAIGGSGSGDSGGSGLSGYQYRLSTNGGSTWGGAVANATATVTGEGETLVQVRSIDGAGNTSAWTPASPGATNTSRIDRTPPGIPTVTGGSSAWQSVASVTVTGSGGSDAGSGVTGYEYRTSTDNGVSWSSGSSGASVAVSAEGVTLVQFRSIDGMGFASTWAPSSPSAASTVKLDHTAPSLPTVAGGSASWLNVGSVAVTGSGATDTGGSGLGAYQYRTSTDGGTTWSAQANGASTVISAEGQTLVQYRSTDTSGNTSAWAPASATAGSTVQLDRTAPTPPTVTGGSLGWQSVASVTVTGSGSTDAGSGVGGYSYRTSTNGGATWSAATTGTSVTISAEGETLVQFRATDALGNASAWGPTTLTATGVVRLDRTNPTGPGASGGGFAWLSTASVTIAGSGATDVGGSGVASYSYRTSTDGGTTWTAGSLGASVPVTGEGETLVQFQAADQAGNLSAWGPAAPSPGGTVRIDRSSPSDPAVSGGSLSWQAVSQVTLAAAGSADSGGAGLVGYQYRTSTDGGVNWGGALAGNPAAVTAEGETVVQFRALDAAGNVSAWAPAVPDAGSTARIDRSGPSLPAVAGGASSWQSVASVTVSASGSTDPQGGFDHYEYRASTDGGTSWSAAQTGASDTITAEGQTLVQFRGVDALGNASPWAPAGATPGSTVRIDRGAPADPTVTGGSMAWQSVSSVGVTAAAATDDLSGIAGYEYRTSTDGGSTWSSAQPGSAAPVTAEGETLVQFRSIDGAGNTSAWAPASQLAGSTVRIDRTAPTAPTVAGGSASWQSVASVTIGASAATDGGSGLAGYQYRTSTDGGTTWLAPQAGTSVAVTAEGETVAQFRSVDAAGNVSGWTPSTPGAASTARIDRTGPAAPTVTGGSLAWQSAASDTVSASGSTDGMAGFAGYEFRTSTDGGTTWSGAQSGSSDTVTAEGQTLVQLRSVDVLGNSSAWTPASPGPTNTVRLDRTSPSDPTVTGGDLAWQHVASVTLAGSGSSDGLSGVDHYEYRTSADGGTSWGGPQTGASDAVTAEGETMIQFRTVDGAGNTSGWAPASPFAGSTARIDRTPPSAPSVAGGSLTWTHAASVTVTGGGSTDSPGSGVTGYQYRTSTDGGTTWTAGQAGSSVTVSAVGETLVQFRSLDVSGLASTWAPAAQNSANTARIDRTTPTAPTVSGGSSVWQNVAKVTITAGGSSDALSGFAHYEYRTSTDGGSSWSSPVTGPANAVTGEGVTLSQFRAVDAAGNVSAWVPSSPTTASTAKIDRSPPTLPTIAGGSLSWTNAATVTVTASGSTDSPGSGVGFYQYRTSTTGGSTWSTIKTGISVPITAAGTTIVQFRVTDASGLATAWAPASPTAGSTVRIDRTLPGAPAVSGGSLTWRSLASASVTASGGTDTGGSAVAGYQYRTSDDNGSSWTSALAGATAAITAEGQTIVQFRTVDGAGNTSAWAPASAGAASTVRLDRTAPGLPTVTGGSLTCAATRTISGSGSTDPGGSGVGHYEYRTSTDGGTTWTSGQTGASVILNVAGSYLVQFRAVDAAGNASAWAPGSATAASQACIT